MYVGGISTRAAFKSHAVAQRRAYTLIELLVVVALIGLLISMLLPSLKRSMELASSTACQSNLRELYRSLTMYRIENDGWIPVPEMASGVAQSRPENGSWFAKLHPTYLPDPLVLSCPEDPYRYRLADDRTQLRDPSVADFSSYGMNSFILSVGNGYLAHADRYQPTRPHDTILVADLGPDRMPRQSYSSRLHGPQRNRSMMMWTDGFDPFSGMPANPWVTTRHSHGINMLTLTGVVRGVQTTDILRSRIRKFYDNCAAGGCTLCSPLKQFHYSFAKDHLYWWTGPLPAR